MADIKVEETMTKNLIKVGINESVIKLAKIMEEKDIGSMIVCDKGKLKGLITSEDLIKRVLIPDKNTAKLKASDVMTKKPVTVGLDEDLADAIRLMIDKGIERLIVLEDKKVVGILTDGDILRMAPDMVESLKEKRSELGMETGDMCEICGNYSESLKRINGLWVCGECEESSPET